MADSAHDHGDSAHEGSNPSARGEKPTDSYCSCCRICDCYRDASGADEKPAERHAEHDQPDGEGKRDERGDDRHDSHDHGDDEHDDHAVDHSDHEDMFRKRFFVSLVLSLPVLYYSPMLQD